MGADAPLFAAVVIGSALILVVAVFAMVAFCRMALSRGGTYEAEIKAPFVTYRVRAEGNGNHPRASRRSPQVSASKNVSLTQDAVSADDSENQP